MNAKQKKSKSKPKRTKHWHVFWRIRGCEYSISTGQWMAAQQAVGVIAAGADVVVITHGWIEHSL